MTVKLLLSGTCLVVVMATPFGDRGSEHGRPSALGGLETAALMAILLAVIGWFGLWPTFVLIFFSISRIREDVKQWN